MSILKISSVICFMHTYSITRPFFSSSKFRLMLNDVKFWFTEIKKWTDSKNTDDQKIGWKALTALFCAVSHGKLCLIESRGEALLREGP